MKLFIVFCPFGVEVSFSKLPVTYGPFSLCAFGLSFAHTVMEPAAFTCGVQSQSLLAFSFLSQQYPLWRLP